MLDSTQNILIAIMVVTIIILLLNLYMLIKFKRGQKADTTTALSSATSVPSAFAGIDSATVAAITAAIGLILDTEVSSSNNATGDAPRAKFIVKSIKKA